MFFYLRQKLKSRFIFAAFWSLLTAACFTTPDLFAQNASDEVEDEADAAQEMRSDEAMGAVETGGYVSGEVMASNPDRKKLTIVDTRYGNEPYVFIVNSSTSFTTASSLADLNPGDSVTVDYFTMEDNRVAENIILEERGGQQEKLPTLEKVLSD